jgi:geranylgeranyl diphosphate synthase type II
MSAPESESLPAQERAGATGGGAFADFLGAVRPSVDAELDRLLPSADEEPARLHEAIRYSIFAGGKRVRPALVLLAGESLGAARSFLLPGAAALEMLHTFSLVHDDLPALDDDELRRGRATVHKRFDEATAVLVGDALLNRGLAILAERPESAPAGMRVGAVSLVAAAVGTEGMIGMIGGQVADLEAENRWPDDAVATLESIHRRKTGALLTACVRLGGLYGGADPEQDAVLARLGERIGLLFQIGDDILDVERSTGELGKTAGKDAEARKLTYPGLFGLDESKRRLAVVRDEALELTVALPAGGLLFASLVEFLAARDH